MVTLETLHEVIKRGDTVAVREYIAAGGSVTRKDSRGWTPLAMAASRGNTPIIRMIIDAGADVNESWPGRNTPLMAAAMAGSLPAVQLLLSRGATPTAEGLPANELLVQLGYPESTNIIEALRNAAGSAA